MNTETMKATMITGNDPLLVSDDMVMPKHSVEKTQALNKEKQELWAKVTELEARITEAKFHAKTWVVVDEDILVHFNNGTYPETDYVFYKDVRLVADGKVREITERENRTVFDAPVKKIIT